MLVEGKASVFRHWLGFFTAQDMSQLPMAMPNPWHAAELGCERQRGLPLRAAKENWHRRTLKHEDREIWERVSGNNVLKTYSQFSPLPSFNDVLVTGAEGQFSAIGV